MYGIFFRFVINTTAYHLGGYSLHLLLQGKELHGIIRLTSFSHVVMNFFNPTLVTFTGVTNTHGPLPQVMLVVINKKNHLNFLRVKESKSLDTRLEDLAVLTIYWSKFSKKNK